MTPTQLKELFQTRFQQEAHVFQAPRCLHLLGEAGAIHGGLSLSAAVAHPGEAPFQLAIAPSGNARTQLYALDFDEQVELDPFDEQAAPSWHSLFEEIVEIFYRKEQEIPAVNCVLGARPTFSAPEHHFLSLATLFAYSLNLFNQRRLPPLELIQLVQSAFLNATGQLCSLTLLFTLLYAQEGHILMIDHQSLEYEQLPLSIPNYELLGCLIQQPVNSHVTHARLSETQEAFERLHKALPELISLQQMTLPMLSHFRTLLNPIGYNRCQFLIEEENRLEQVLDHLAKPDWLRFGQALFTSQSGLRLLYESSNPKVDLLLEQTRRNFDVLGARMLLAGNGSVQWVRKERVEMFKRELKEAFGKSFSEELSLGQWEFVGGIGE